MKNEKNVIVKKILKVFGRILAALIGLGLILWINHNICNLVERRKLSIPGDKVEIYDGEFISSVKIGKGKYTIVLLPGMGTASPYYDYYNLANLLSQYSQVVIIEPLGYGFSDNTLKVRNLDNYEYELNKVLNYYDIKENIILLGHSYSGIQNLNYANKHNEVRGLVCLDCTTAYQIESHVKNNKFINEPPVYAKSLSLLSKLGLTRFVYGTFARNNIKKDLLSDIPLEYHSAYKYFLYNKTMNKTIINELNGIPYNQLELLHQKYNNNLHTITFLSDESVEEMKEYKKDGDFLKDWEEMHNLLISNESIQKIYVLHGDHYIHHHNTKEISDKIFEMINELN